VSLSAPAPTLYACWETLADGLHVQRLALHLPQIREQLHGSPARTPSTQVAPEILLAAPSALTDLPARRLIADAGLEHWLRIPAEHATAADGPNPLRQAADQAVDSLLGDVPDSAVRAAVTAVGAASAWWVGAFAVIRHLGVHHETLQPVTDLAQVETLTEATRIAALGVMQRVLIADLRTGHADDSVRRAYCRAVTDSVIAETQLPGLIGRLGELRLADLVATSIPWRGRFTKYAGGTGAGQVE
jgi:hypothetical protein